MWDLPGPGLEPVSPALAGRFLTTAPPGKPCKAYFKKQEKDWNSLAVQWLGLGTFSTKGPGSITDPGAKVPQATWHGQKTKQNESKKKINLKNQGRGHLWKKDVNVSFLNLVVDTMLIIAIVLFKLYIYIYSVHFFWYLRYILQQKKHLKREQELLLLLDIQGDYNRRVLHSLCSHFLFLKAFSIHSCQANQMSQYNLKVNIIKC